MHGQGYRVDDTFKVDVNGSKIRWQRIAIRVRVVFKIGRSGRNPGVGEDMIYPTMRFDGKFEQRGHFCPRGNVGFLESESRVFEGSRINVTIYD